jgi:uncharacterized protein
MSERDYRLPAPGRLHSPKVLARILVPAVVAAFLVSLATVRAAHPQAEPKIEPKIKIAFVGDSTADGLWGGVARLVPRESCLKSTVELGRFAKNSTGLTRPDRFNWADETRKIGDSFKPQLLVMSLGLNDRQSVVEKSQVTMESSALYPARYKERVTAVLKSARASKASLLWVGLPAMREAAADRDAREKNKLFAEAIVEFGAETIQYAPPWRLGGSGEDKFASFGPDLTGKIIQIRATDGEHFTPAGELLVAAYLLPKMVATLVKDGAPLGEGCGRQVGVGSG